MWEEPILSGTSGSGTIFFSGCTMACVFCQNQAISRRPKGKRLSPAELSEVMLRLQAEGCHNINLVTADHYIHKLPEAIRLSRAQGLKIPIALNTSSYIKAESLQRLDGLVEIYLADLKYFHDRYAVAFSRAPGYFGTASAAIAEMYRQRGPFRLNEEGLLQSGLIIRHLALPGLFFDSKKLIHYVYETYGDGVFFSLMNQYTPLNNVTGQLARKLSEKEYDRLLDEASVFSHGFCQDEPDEDETFYIPAFDGTGVPEGEWYED